MEDSQFWVVAGSLGVFALLYFLNRRKTEEIAEPARPVAAIKRDLTLEQLKNYNGENSQPVFVALKGTIFDVSSSEFYRKPSGYAVFAGHDASINLAKMSHDEDLLNAFWDKGETLSGEEKGTLEDWFQRFSQKYPVVGSVIRQ